MNTVTESLLLALRRHWIPALAAFTSVIGSALFYIAKTPPQYESSTRLILDDRAVSISALGQNLAELQNKPPGDANPLATQSELVTSQQVIERALKKLQPKLYMLHESLTTDDLKKLNVSIIPATNILEVTYQSDNPKLTVAVLNAIAESMVEESAAAIRSGALSVRDFLEREVPKQQLRLEQAEVLEDQYRQRSGLVSPEEQTRNLVKSLTDTENQAQDLIVQLQGNYARSTALQGLTNTQSLGAAYASVQAGQNATLTTLQAKLTDLEANVVEARSRLGDQHPDLQALIQQRNETRSLYNQQIKALLVKTPQPQQLATDEISQTLIANLITSEVERLALEKQLQVVQAARTQMQARLQRLPAQQQPLTTLTRKREEAATTLAALQTKLEEAQIAEAQLVSNIRITDYAWEPTASTWPKPAVVLVIATVAGAILGAGVILLLEQLDGTIRTIPDATEILHLPILGVLPKLPPLALPLQDPTHFFQLPELVEPYQMFLKTLTIRSQKSLWMVVVSSVSADEGKSTVASHLAAVASFSKRTLLIDADLRRPVQDQCFGVKASPGLTDVLNGNISLIEAVQSTEIPSLSVLTHGTPSPYPTSVLGAESLNLLLQDARANYDLVIIDTPPISLCAETTTVVQQSNALVLVVRPHITLKDKLRQVVTELTNSGLPLTGVVINGAKRSSDQYSLLQSPSLSQSSLQQRVRSSLNHTDQNQEVINVSNTRHADSTGSLPLGRVGEQ